jgi:hypothetical protein
MSVDERASWIQLLTAIGTYIAYAAIVLARADGGPLPEVAYTGVLIWMIGISVVMTIVLTIIGAIVSVIVTGDTEQKSDVRDRQINRAGEYFGHFALVAGALGAMVLAMVEAEPFWIANAIYAGFTVSAIVSSSAKAVLYRRGM